MKFLAMSQHRPTPSQRKAIADALKEIDPALSVQVSKMPGTAPCWIQGPPHYADAAYRDRAEAAICAFRAVMP